jgi:hypothetical protein
MFLSLIQKVFSNINNLNYYMGNTYWRRKASRWCSSSSYKWYFIPPVSWIIGNIWSCIIFRLGKKNHAVHGKAPCRQSAFQIFHLLLLRTCINQLHFGLTMRFSLRSSDKIKQCWAMEIMIFFHEREREINFLWFWVSELICAFEIARQKHKVWNEVKG